MTGWNPGVDATHAVDAAVVPDAIFKGIAVAPTPSGSRLFAADFHHGTVDVFDGSFHRIDGPGMFTDPQIPKAFAPFNVAVVGGRIAVAYAERDAEGIDDLHGRGLGYVDLFAFDGHLVRRVARRGVLNAPWGLAVAPAGFGPFGGALLVGNFGDGRIHAYDLRSGALLGTLRDPSGKAIAIDGLWGLQVGNATIGGSDALLFTAGPDDEAHGLFGTLRFDH